LLSYDDGSESGATGRSGYESATLWLGFSEESEK
jgi:hypothetical protein